MTEERVVKTVNFLLMFASVCLFYGLTYLAAEQMDDTQKVKTCEEKIQKAELPIKAEKRSRFPALINSKADFEKVIIPGTEMETEYLGDYFITAYCPEECGGSWSTSSGATCHYHDEWYEPTTCAIDRTVHGYNELILVGEPDDPDRKVYVTEDTGPGVKGHWIDCFVVSMGEVRSWDTGWRPCYSVSFSNQNIIKPKARYIYESFTNYLFMRCDGYGPDLWNDRGADD